MVDLCDRWQFGASHLAHDAQAIAGQLSGNLRALRMVDTSTSAGFGCRSAPMRAYRLLV
jgi:hypothetical protein